MPRHLGEDVYVEDEIHADVDAVYRELFECFKCNFPLTGGVVRFRFEQRNCVMNLRVTAWNGSPSPQLWVGDNVVARLTWNEFAHRIARNIDAHQYGTVIRC